MYMEMVKTSKSQNNLNKNTTGIFKVTKFKIYLLWCYSYQKSVALVEQDRYMDENRV